MARTRNTTDKHDEALKVFILNDQDEDTKDESLKLFVKLYSMRLRTDREFWLFDATALIKNTQTSWVWKRSQDENMFRLIAFLE